MKKKKSVKQIAALVCVILLVLMYIVTFVVAFFTDKGGARLFITCAAFTIVIPIACWGFIWMYGALTHKRTIATIFDEPKEQETEPSEAVSEDEPDDKQS